MESVKLVVKLTVAVSIALACVSCFVSRLRRPEITGIVCDYSGKSVAACKVGEVVTDSCGRFTLKEKRYRQFTMPGMEAPPLFVSEEVSKKGYNTVYLKAHNTFGGGARRGQKWDIGTVFLRKENEILNTSVLLHEEWECSASKHFDTLYLIKNEKEYNFFSEGDAEFSRQFDNFRYGGVGDINSIYYTGNLPDTLLAHSYYLTFLHNGELGVRRVQEYRVDLPNDTIDIKGAYRIEEPNVVWLDSRTLSELNGLYVADTIELKWMMLVRQPKE